VAGVLPNERLVPTTIGMLDRRLGLISPWFGAPLALLNERHLVQMCQVFRSERKLTYPQTRRSAEAMVYKTLWARLRLAVTRAVKLDG
jgi:hypothetical protein